MTEPRVPETDDTLWGPAHAEAYNQMQAHLRDRGWLETNELLATGIAAGRALEVGAGPGYLGLEWLRRTSGTRIVGVDQSPDMIAIALRNASELGLTDRAAYILGQAQALPLEDATFDAVFATRSLHEWIDPRATLRELWRVVKRGGRLFVSDLRRDLSPSARNFLEKTMTSAAVLEGLRASIGAAYTTEEIRVLIAETELAVCEVTATPLGLRVSGSKPE